MKIIKQLNRRVLSFARSIDTLTTKLLTLVLFVTVIPLMVIGSFSSDIINQLMSDNAQNDLNNTMKLVNYAYDSKTNQIKKVSEGILGPDQLNLNQNILLGDLKSIKNSTRATLAFIVNKDKKIIASTAGIRGVSGDISKLISLALSGEKITSIEKIMPEDVKTDLKKPIFSGLSLVIVLPLKNDLNKVISALVVSKKIAADDEIPRVVKSATDSNIIVYEIDNLAGKSVSTNITQPTALVDMDIIKQLKANNPVAIRTSQLYGNEISRYSPIRNYFGRTVGAIYLGIPENKVLEPVSRNVQFISNISVISLLVAILIAAFFARTITTPIFKLVSAAKSIARGDLRQRVKINGNDEIAQLSNTFNFMGENLLKQEQLRDNFIATLTHDLKVPMLAENQTITYFLKGDYGPITEEQKEVLSLVKSTNKSSLEMVTTLLEVYRYSTGTVNLIRSNFDFVKLVKQSIEEIKSLAEEKKITIMMESFPESIEINADEREIKRVMHNLISNAIYNGIHRGQIHCRIEAVTNKRVYNPDISPEMCSTLLKKVNISNSVLISIKDDGIGIMREDMPQLFKRFSLSKGRKPAGTGLGLYYSHQVITMHDGNIWVESAEGHGSTFRFSLPLKDTELE